MCFSYCSRNEDYNKIRESKIGKRVPLLNDNRGVLEFLLANHPLDCPICDQGGECDLQEITIAHGFERGRFNEFKRAVESPYIGPIVHCTLRRCIHCSRCVRFGKEIIGDYSLAENGRSKYKEVGTYKNDLLTNELSGNVADICPVGSLLAKVI